MLHDLYLLSYYFEGPQAVLYEDDLRKRYGLKAVAEALKQGLIEVYCAPCSKGEARLYCRISRRGMGQVLSSSAV